MVIEDVASLLRTRLMCAVFERVDFALGCARAAALADGAGDWADSPLRSGLGIQGEEEVSKQCRMTAAGVQQP